MELSLVLPKRAAQRLSTGFKGQENWLPRWPEAGRQGQRESGVMELSAGAATRAVTEGISCWPGLGEGCREEGFTWGQTALIS